MGVSLSPKPEWATLPIACIIISSALTMAPSVLVLKSWGRKRGSMFGLSLLVLGALVCAYASSKHSFTILIVGAVFLGAGMAFLQQLRFAAIESVEESNIAPTLSLLLLGAAVAALVGPELASYGRRFSDTGQDFTVSFIFLAVINVFAIALFSQFENPLVAEHESSSSKRPLSKIVRQPIFLAAVVFATLGFAVMSFLMTSTPVAMTHFHNHSIDDTKWVIQSHMLAMFLPSLFSGILIKRFGAGAIALCGALLFGLVLCIASIGHELLHFWWALVLLGVGWNFLFVSGTTLLPQSYSHSERFGAQAVNDFFVFSFQAIASLSAGWVLFKYGWSVQLLLCIPLVVVAFALSVFMLFPLRVKGGGNK